MRLAAVKIRGFKSFADPVSFKADGALIGVIGPNGCGKSNIVDAIRWGLGESRASSLRSTSLPDVLFNGSATRGAASFCDVELHFDNSDASAPAMWNAYARIVVKRELGRDGRQGYRINENPVRRRDVIDLFRGTGVAPRAYGVIEQGMITHIADSSPEELRNFMEEAAGVSHYKERRRESERRLQAAQDNLAQVALILDGLVKRANALKRQAQKAKEYRELSHDINTLDALLVAAKRDDANEKLTQEQERIIALEKHITAFQSSIGEVKVAEEQNRSKRGHMQNDADALQQKLSAMLSALAAVERDLQNAATSKASAQKKLSDSQEDLISLTAQVSDLTNEIATLSGEAKTVEKNITDCGGVAQQQTAELAQLQEEKSHKQEKLDIAREKSSAARQTLEAQMLRQQVLEEKLAALDKRIGEAETTLAGISPENDFFPPDLSGIEAQLTEQENDLHAKKAKHNAFLEQKNAEESTIRAVENDLAILTTEMSTLRTMLAEESNGLEGEDSPRLAHLLQVEAGDWALALDAALGEYASAIAVDDLNAFHRQHASTAGTAIVELKAITDTVPNRLAIPTLLSVLDLPPSSREILASWLGGVYVANSDEEVLTLRQQLRAGESIVTQNGHVFSARAFLARGETRGGYNWEQRMRDLSKAKSDKQQQLVAANKQHAATLNKAASASEQQDDLLRALEETRHHLAEQKIELSRQQERHHSNQQRRQEITESVQAMRGEQQEINHANAGFDEKLQALTKTQDDEQKAFLAVQTEAENINNLLEEHRKKITGGGEQKRTWELKHAAIAQQRASIAARLDEMDRRKKNLETHIQTYQTEVSTADESTLQQQITQHQEAVAKAKAALADCRQQLQNNEDERNKLEKKMEGIRGDVEAMQKQIAEKRVTEGELKMTVDYCIDSLEEFSLTVSQLTDIQNAHSGEGVSDWTAAIESKRNKRERLGAINFAAESELHDSEERITEIQTQKTDVEAAITELQTTIQRIDMETKARLQNMYDGVNRKFVTMFRQLFGGGEAKLEMIGGDSILESGFELRVQPPGKRLFSVRMLSGGEKAAAAVAFVFAILRLNPPPFCILDEVDASLDENRSQRFSQLLGEIAKNVQCLVVTHNKGTIAALPKLVGVTQEEPGVSKIVTTTLEPSLRNTL